MNQRSRKGSSRRYESPGKKDRREAAAGERQCEIGALKNVVYGVNPVREMLRSSAGRIERILIANGVREHRLNEIRELARRQHLTVDRVESDQFERIIGRGVNHQGVAAFISAADYFDADEMVEALDAGSLVLLLDGVEDPRNLGAILRTAECAGVDCVFIPARRAVGLTDTVAKSSAGAIEHIRVAKIANLNRLIDDLKKQKIWVVGATGNASIEYTEWDWSQPTALVLGSEGSGLHRLVAENCDVLVKIPMYGKIDSLNVSVAAGVILFEAQRQRSVNGG